MSTLKGGLYASRTAQEKLIKVFMQLHQCLSCHRYFIEMENLGSWSCTYHPGEYDYNSRRYTCCGETANYSHGNFHAVDHLIAWNQRQRLTIPPLFSKGCKRCDCRSKDRNAVPKKSVLVHEIASMLPSMIQYGSELKKRPGFRSHRTVKEMKIERFEWLPPQLFDSVISPYVVP